MARNYTPIPDEFLEEMEELSDAEYGRLIRWMQEANITGEQQELCGNERFYAKRCLNTLKRFNESYEETAKTRSEAGKRGAARRWENSGDGKNGKAINGDGKNGKAINGDGKNGYTEPKTEPKTDIPVTTVTGNNGGAQVRFTPPTLQEVEAYCQERGNAVDPQHFVDFYSAKGWMIGKNRMKDWKAAVRNWEHDSQPMAQVKPWSAAAYKGNIDSKTVDMDKLKGLMDKM
jgi:hypothetical protein